VAERNIDEGFHINPRRAVIEPVDEMLHATEAQSVDGEQARDEIETRT
jgi:hypothetical protein